VSCSGGGVSAGSLAQRMDALWRQQSARWAMMKTGLDGLKRSSSRWFDVNGSQVLAQCNPARVKSAGAKVDAASLAARPCFLCASNRPAEQESIPYRDGWVVLCNPMPIFDPHFTVVAENHVPQRIIPALPTMLGLSHDTGGRFTVFYNGPLCGASAPDHLHVQAAPSGASPFEAELAEELNRKGEDSGQGWIEWLRSSPVRLGVSRAGRRPAVFLTGQDEASVREAARHAIEVLGEVHPAEPEPMLNLFVAFTAGRWSVWFYPRRAHRPSCFGHGPEQCLISPGAADLAGILILPRPTDFERITADDVASVFGEVLLTPQAFARLRDRLRG